MANSVNFSTYGFLDDILALTEENWRRYFKPFIYDSVQSGLQVSAGSGMTVNVSSGECRCGSIMGILSSPVSLDAYIGDETYPRIDCIIAQYTYDDPSTLVVAVLKGTAGETPVAPSLVKTYNSLWQMELAQILVPAGATTTAECTITDKRVIYNSLDDKLSVYSSNASEWDTTPTTNSTKPVTSGGTKNALDGKLANYASGASEWDTTPTASSTKPVTSGGIKIALDEKANNPIIADYFSSSNAYAVGNYVIYDGALYRFISAHSAGSWNSNHVTQVSAMSSALSVINLDSTQTVSDVALDSTICNPTGITILNPRNASRSDGVPSVYGVAIVTKRLSSVAGITLITDDGDVYTRGYNGSAWTKWRYKGLLYFTGVGCSTNGTICRIPSSGSDTRITSNTIVLNLTFSKPQAITSNVSWSSSDDGYITFTGTCTDATCTMNVTLGQKGN